MAVIDILNMQGMQSGLISIFPPLQKPLPSSQFQNAPFCPISAADENFSPRNMQNIPVVKIFVFLDLEQN
jgi:hypothetical protein